jgi:SPP1 gp7 family putative phage head morphogenesis protein
MITLPSIDENSSQSNWLRLLNQSSDKAEKSAPSSQQQSSQQTPPPTATPLTEATSIASGAITSIGATANIAEAGLIALAAEEIAARWPGWVRDQAIAGIYAPRIVSAIDSALQAINRFLIQLVSGQVRVTPTYAAHHIRGLIRQDLTPVLTDLWTEGYVLGHQSAGHLTAAAASSSPGTSGPAWGWEPGDAAAAAQSVSGGRLTQLVEQSGPNMLERIAETRLDDLPSVIATALDTKQTPQALTGLIQDALRIEKRAPVIAQTEVTRAVSAGTMDRYHDDGIDTKQWLVSPDEKVCKICRGAEAQGPVALSKAFDNGFASPPGHVSCRCTLIPASVHGFDLTDMVTTPLPGFNVVPMQRAPAEKSHASNIKPLNVAEKQHNGEQFITCDRGHKHWGKLGAAGILIRAPRPDGKMAYLLQRRSLTGRDNAGKWGTFGGALLPGELPLAGAVRECNEELGSIDIVKYAAPDVMKVGKEGYIHGYICVRPPCGPEYTQAAVDDHGVVTHDSKVIGGVGSLDGGRKFTAIYGEGMRATALTGEFDSRDEAVRRITAVHDLTMLRKSLPETSRTRGALGLALDPLIEGDAGEAARVLRIAYSLVRVDEGDDGLMSHIQHIRKALDHDDEEPVELLPVRRKTLAAGALLDNDSDVVTVPPAGAKGFDAWLPPADAAELRELVRDGHLSFSDGRNADRLNELKTAAVTGILTREYGLPETVAHGLTGVDQDGDALNWGSVSKMHTAHMMLNTWAMGGGANAEYVADWYEQAMSMRKPNIVDSDWDVATGDGESDFTHMGNAALQHRVNAAQYYGARAQQRYAQEVLREVPATAGGQPLTVTRAVTGKYAANLKSLATKGGDWQAAVRALSSWAEPEPAAEQSINRLIKWYPDGDDVAWLTTQVSQSNVFATWRGEGTLRNDVVALGEVVVASGSKLLTSKDTTVSQEMP